jgi:hypothetical protein
MAMAILSATGSLAEQVKTDHDRNADFSRYKTYSWGKRPYTRSAWVDRIKASVNSALAALLAPGKPALFIFVTEDGTVQGWNPGVSPKP